MHLLLTHTIGAIDLLLTHTIGAIDLLLTHTVTENEINVGMRALQAHKLALIPPRLPLRLKP